MKLLRVFKYLTITSFLSLVFVSSAVAAGSPVATKSNELKTKSCLAREQIIKTRMNNLERLTQNMFEVFGKIEARTEEFYQNKLVVKGTTVASYSTLLQNVESKKSSAEKLLLESKNDISGFSCANVNPKTSLTEFRKDMQSVKSALKEYRTSIKNLIVAVKSANKESDSNDLSGSPKPTKAQKN